MNSAETPAESNVFVSYKREDEARVAPLVEALEAAGHSVWWDRGLPAGENWRVNIQQALDAAGCVVVVWTRQSVGESGQFVQDEAGQGQKRDILVPVLLDRVRAPIGFGQIQAIDLKHWRGKARDPYFQDLLSAIEAKLTGDPVPKAKGPAARRRKQAWGGLLTTLATIVAIIGLNVLGIQDKVCASSLVQPAVSDFCGAMGLGDRPTRAERVAWAETTPGSCADLREHLERFPGGAHAEEAAARLAARRETAEETWTPEQKRLALFIGASDSPTIDETAAKALALEQAQTRVTQLCNGFAATSVFKLESAWPEAETWNCERVKNGIVCGFEGWAVCDLQRRGQDTRKQCGVAP